MMMMMMMRIGGSDNIGARHLYVCISRPIKLNIYSMPVCLQERGTRDYDVVVVGHSLGAGTAAILAILLRQDYPNLHCYAYSPPGGLLR